MKTQSACFPCSDRSILTATQRGSRNTYRTCLVRISGGIWLRLSASKPQDKAFNGKLHSIALHLLRVEGDFCSRRRSKSLQKALRGSSWSIEDPSEDPMAKEVENVENGAFRSVNGNDSTPTDEEFSSTLRLVESAMLAAAVGLAYFLSNSLRIENYFGCFFPLPPVISSLRWGAAAGRKTMVATVMLLLVISGPLRAASYLLMHGFTGLAMGTLWRSNISWGLSVFVCTLVRSLGAMGFVFLSSWLLRDNLLSLITINAHASISYMLAAFGINIVPSMGSIYFIFGTLVLLNCGSFVFLLHVLYAIFVRRLGLNPSLTFPAWLKAL